MPSCILAFAMLMLPALGPAAGCNPQPVPLGPPYIIDSYFIDSPIAVDGFLGEPAWTAPTTSVTKTTLITNGWNLTIRTFFNATSLFVGVEFCGDTSMNPNDRCEICFDTDHDATSNPDNQDMKLVAKGTTAGVDDYLLYYGDGAAWVKYSDNLGTPNPWPAGFAADGEKTVNNTYEFMLPIAAAWGEANPPDGKIAGFTVHGYGQADNIHVWWPDKQGTGINPATEYCDKPDTWGDIIYHSPADPPDHLDYVSGSNQTAEVGTVLAQPLSVRTKNQTGGNVSGAPVNFTMTAPPGSVGHGFAESGLAWHTAYSNSLGYANVTIQLGSRPGAYNISATGMGFTGIAGPTYIDWLHANATIGPLATLQTRPNPTAVAPLGTSAVTIWANDSFGNGITGLTVAMAFDSNPSGGTLSPTATDNNDGTYSASYTAGSTGGVVDVVNATSGGKWGKAPIQVSALPLNTIEISSNATAVKVTQQATLTIWANDTGGGGMAGQTIILSFAPNLSGAFLTGVSEIGGGVYSATYTAGQTAWVTDTVKASCSGKEDTVGINVQAGVPSDLVYVSGNGQQGNVSQTLPQPFIVRAEDAFGNIVPGTPVAWAIASFPAGATGHSLTPANNATDASGLSGTKLALGNLAGWYNATATSASVPGDSVAFSAVCLPPPVIPQVYSIFLVSGNNQSGSISSVLPLPLTIEVRTQTSVPASGVRVWFNVTGGGGSVGAAVADTGANGRASTTLTLGPAAGLNRVTAQISSGGTKTVTFVANATAPELTATLAANITSVLAGKSVMYVISFGNSGTEAAKDVRLNFTLRSGLSYISDTSGSAPVVTQTVLAWTFDSAPEGQNSFNLVCGVGTQMSGSIQTHFDVNYSSQSGIEQIAVRSNSVTVNVLQEAQANVPPVIEGVPDLTVHYDWDYRIDLAPYIADPDSAFSELVLILSDNVHARVDPARNTAIILNYSQDLVGMPQTLNITVSDGYGSDWDSITVTVSDDFPPELVGIMPDITFNEDTVHYGFNISNYFLDRDGDALIYTYGERHLTVTIMDVNSTVQIVPELNWYGQESVTFRALDPSGALVEDTVLVTVNPVNDPPVAAAVPDQVGRVNVTWVLDLSPYLSDVDNALDQLILSVDSEYATVNGLNITFRCAVSVNDIVTVTVSDGYAQTYLQINILVEYPPETPESLPSWILALIVIIAIAAIILLAAAMRKPVIEQAFLIYKDGALLAHSTNRMIPDMDTQIFSSMFTAIQDFIKDSFKDEKNWSLDKLEFGDNKIFIARGKEGLYSLSLIYKGRDRGLQNISKKAIEAIDKAYGKEFKDWDGNMDRFRGVRDVLSDSIFK